MRGDKGSSLVSGVSDMFALVHVTQRNASSGCKSRPIPRSRSASCVVLQLLSSFLLCAGTPSLSLGLFRAVPMATGLFPWLFCLGWLQFFIASFLLAVHLSEDGCGSDVGSFSGSSIYGSWFSSTLSIPTHHNPPYPHTKYLNHYSLETKGCRLPPYSLPLQMRLPFLARLNFQTSLSWRDMMQTRGRHQHHTTECLL